MDFSLYFLKLISPLKINFDIYLDTLKKRRYTKTHRG